MPTVQGFRDAFPYFTVEMFPDSRVEFQLSLARQRLGQEKWGDWWENGCYLFTAHFLTLERVANLDASGTGGMSAAAGAVVSSSKSVGGVSKSEGRAGAAATGDIQAGQWNDTIYGRQYWDLLRIVGAGGLHV